MDPRHLDVRGDCVQYRRDRVHFQVPQRHGWSDAILIAFGAGTRDRHPLHVPVSDGADFLRAPKKRRDACLFHRFAPHDWSHARRIYG